MGDLDAPSDRLRERARRPLLLQAHWGDFDSFGPLIEEPTLGLAARALRAVRSGGPFDRVVLVTGEDARNARVHDFARRASLESFAGDDADVGRRFAACMEQHGFERGARALLHHFTVDFDGVARAFELLERDGTQYVELPRDLDLRFACDVFTADFLAVARVIADEHAGDVRRRLLHTPWAAADLAPERFRLSQHDRVPTYGAERFAEVRTITNALYPERSRKVGIPASAYEQAARCLPRGIEDVLDVACGWGDGTAALAQRFPNVTGADYDAEQIARNASAHPTADFVSGDATDPTLFDAHAFDAIVSIHSMEHFQDDQAFLAACRRWLRPHGRLVLEVPLTMELPFPGIDTPLGEDHVREYRVPALEAFVRESGFEVLDAFGVARGLYLPVARARNAVMLLLAPR